MRRVRKRVFPSDRDDELAISPPSLRLPLTTTSASQSISTASMAVGGWSTRPFVLQVDGDSDPQGSSRTARRIYINAEVLKTSKNLTNEPLLITKWREPEDTESAVSCYVPVLWICL